MKYAILFLFSIGIKSVSGQSVDSIAVKQVDSLIKYSRDLTAKRDFEKALELNSQAQKIALEKLGHESASYASTCHNYGRVLYFKGNNYQESEKWYQEALAIREKVLGKMNTDYAATLNNLSNIFKEEGKYEKAEVLQIEAKNIQEKLLGREHPHFAASLHNLALIYWELGQYEKAEPLYLQALAIRERVIGKLNPDYAWNLNNLAGLYFEMVKYEKAEPLFLEANSIFAQLIGNDHPAIAGNLSNLSALYEALGNQSKAEYYTLEALRIREKALGKEHPDYASSLISLGQIHQKMNDFNKAEALFLEAKNIREKVLGKEHPDYAGSLNNFGSLYLKMDKPDKAEALFLEAKTINEKVFGREHQKYAASLGNLALVYKVQGKYDKAESLMIESNSLLEKIFGTEHSSYIFGIRRLAGLYVSMKEYQKAEPLFCMLSHADQKVMQNAVYYLSEKELGDYLNSFTTNQNIELSFAQLSNSKELMSECYNNTLFYKGFLLQALDQLKRISFTNPTTTENFNLLKSYQRRLAFQYAQPLLKRDNIIIGDLETKANILEKDLARTITKYSKIKQQTKWEDVRQTLKSGELAIEFVHYYYGFIGEKDKIMYSALVLKPGNNQPLLIPLFEDKSLDSLLHSKSDRKADYVNSLYTLADRGAVAVDASKRSLYEILWKPLEKELTGIKTIYYSPSGLLHRINLDAIPVSETETLADKYQLIELNSTRQLVIPNQIKIANNDAVLFGGIQFEQDTTVQKEDPILASRSRGELSFSSVDSTLRGGSWNYLAGTEREVNSIEKIMQSTGVNTNLKKGSSATEEFFKNIGTNNNSSPRILHIATHGYFFADPKESHQSSVISLQEEPVFKISEHPMLRSGLIMAGGNAVWQGQQTLEGKEDGILTAYEISQMNLSNTELVVLSACETGLGDIQGNEGVYGLQRAFKIAGAKYLIMSLWQVPDKQTSLLMTTFYKKWLEEKMSIQDAFHAAQKELRDNGLDPYNWAGFVLVE